MPLNPHESFPYQRIVVIGVTGCGKTYLAEKLARKLKLGFIELDALFWKPNWVESTLVEFRQKVDLATAGPAWALAGNYNQSRDLIWPRAQAIVWLDYPFLVSFERQWKRTLTRWWTQEPLWGTNTERLLPQLKFWSKKSLFYWQVRSYRRHKWFYPQLIASSEYSHLKFFRFKNPHETEAWLDSLI
jgi:ATPase family associated with various cellular activities (AAA)